MCLIHIKALHSTAQTPSPPLTNIMASCFGQYIGLTPPHTVPEDCVYQVIFWPLCNMRIHAWLYNSMFQFCATCTTALDEQVLTHSLYMLMQRWSSDTK